MTRENIELLKKLLAILLSERPTEEQREQRDDIVEIMNFVIDYAVSGRRDIRSRKYNQLIRDLEHLCVFSKLEKHGGAQIDDIIDDLPETLQDVDYQQKLVEILIERRGAKDMESMYRVIEEHAVPVRNFIYNMSSRKYNLSSLDESDGDSTEDYDAKVAAPSVTFMKSGPDISKQFINRTPGSSSPQYQTTSLSSAEDNVPKHTNQ